MRKKIFHVTFDMRIGGAEQVILNLVENSDHQNFDVQIICLEAKIGPFGKQLQDKGYRIHTCNRRPGFDISLIAAIRSLIHAEKIDVLHCHQYTPYVYGVLAAMATPCKVIFTEHGRFFPDTRKIKRTLINPFLSIFTAHITAISAATKGALVRYENFSEKKIQIIYNGIDDSRFITEEAAGIKESLGIPAKAFVLGTVARLDPIKNHPMMIKALKKIRTVLPDTYLLIIGDGPERPNLEKLAEDLDLENFVLFTGFREDTPLFYKILDIFLLTSFSEGTAMTLLEAMASGLPCLATDVGGNPEIVAHDETGFIIPTDDEEVLASTAVRLLRDRNLSTYLGKRGRARFEKKFTVRTMAESYQQLYYSA